jgi:2-iminobutanoate/2-iminopropanoate deaminase
MSENNAPAAPVAIGPYSMFTRAGNLVFLSGQVALDPATGQLAPGDVSAQTHRVMKNLAAVLAAADASFDKVMKTTIYLVDMNHFQEVNAVYATYFTAKFPARATVEVSALPRGALVEIDAIAAL